MSASDVDPEDLDRELRRIKTAIGLDDRYPGQRRMWLVYGLGIGLASIVTNAVFVFDLPPVVYVLGWFLMVAIVGALQWGLVSKTGAEPAVDGPDWWVLGVTLLVALLVLWVSLGNVIAVTTAGAVRGAHYFSHVLIVLGVGFVLAGNGLKAYRIRRRDRIPFYAGGAWMLALAAFVPHVGVLQYGGYAIFGVLFVIHSVATYVLTRPT